MESNLEKIGRQMAECVKVHDVPKHLHDIFLEYHDGCPSIFSKYDPDSNILIVLSFIWPYFTFPKEIIH
ncbi:hypothetical protein I3843_14G043000 [Carya illinoinensis]|nr:hypothetical protein I3843_14G043000 [Carya illinoinensis]